MLKNISHEMVLSQCNNTDSGVSVIMWVETGLNGRPVFVVELRVIYCKDSPWPSADTPERASTSEAQARVIQF